VSGSRQFCHSAGRSIAITLRLRLSATNATFGCSPLAVSNIQETPVIAATEVSAAIAQIDPSTLVRCWPRLAFSSSSRRYLADPPRTCSRISKSIWPQRARNGPRGSIQLLRTAQVWEYAERQRRPQAIYTDKARMFQPTLAPG